jgi:hypothetical protein
VPLADLLAKLRVAPVNWIPVLATPINGMKPEPDALRQSAQ